MDGVSRIDGKSSEALTDTGGRDRQRDSLFMVATLRIGGASDTHEVRVRNLSVGGLMIEFNQPLDPGAAVALDMRGLGELTGTVAWCTRGRAGIALDQPIDPKQVRKPVGQGTSTPVYVKPILVSRVVDR